MRSNTALLCASTLAAVALVGCAATPHHESTGAYFDDATVTSKVKADLIEDPLTKARDISVTTDQGIVQLSGFVDSKEQRDEAVRIATAVSGVRSVQDDLHVKGDGNVVATGKEDDVITRSVKDALDANPATNTHEIKVRTSDGVVELSGFIDSNDQRDLAAHIAESVEGVRTVYNGLQLKQPSQ
jgi:hyperosmotically inducible protein